jgi:hypothetical protein
MIPGGIFVFLLFLLSWTPMVLGADFHNSDTDVPPAGMSGIYHDKDKKVLHTYYGSNDLEEHMVHLLENQKQYPENIRQYSVPKTPSDTNRKKAMEISNLDPLPGTARDEKPPNFVTHDGKSVSVKRVPAEESSKHFLGRTQYRMNRF